MATKNRKKRKLMGARSQGYGCTQKHRGAGSRGGRGMAGSKKHKWIMVSKKMPGYFGRSGFLRHESLISSVSTINVGVLDERIEKLAKEGKAEEKKGVYSIDLSVVGVDKLLGSGVASHRMMVKVAAATQRAIEKIEAAGGSVEVPESAESESSEQEVSEEKSSKKE